MSLTPTLQPGDIIWSNPHKNVNKFELQKFVIPGHKLLDLKLIWKYVQLNWTFIFNELCKLSPHLFRLYSIISAPAPPVASVICRSSSISCRLIFGISSSSVSVSTAFLFASVITIQVLRLDDLCLNHRPHRKIELLRGLHINLRIIEFWLILNPGRLR